MLKKLISIYIEEFNMILETGFLAKKSNGSLIIGVGETKVFISTTTSYNINEYNNFFPLHIDYREKFTAVGRFPGGYFKREGRPTEKEILTSRLCDRPLRPLFPKGLINEVQIVGLLLSSNGIYNPDILMVNGASAALMISDIPWNGPIGCLRIGYINNQFIINPSSDLILKSDIDLVYVGTKDKIIMVEGSAKQVSEEVLIKAIYFAQQKIRKIINMQIKFAKIIKNRKKTFIILMPSANIINKIVLLNNKELKKSFFITDSKERNIFQNQLKNNLEKIIIKELTLQNNLEIFNYCLEFVKKIIFKNIILDEKKRIDNRQFKELRKIYGEVNTLPSVHGSAIFQRGETQALMTITLGTGKDAQEMDIITGGIKSKSFILHYNFPPFSVGETGKYGLLNRREVGHGSLAEKSLLPVIPSDKFHYTIRLVSEIMESNGSTSMATVCAGTLALMDAGIPISNPVVGISIGLITNKLNGKKMNYALLTDILGIEDHYGDMDFKIAGTEKGITGFQLDLKINGIPLKIFEQAIYQSRKSHYEILEVLLNIIPVPRLSMKNNAPKIKLININPNKIGSLIGVGGKNIKKIIEETGADIDINEDNSGEIKIFAKNEVSLQKALEKIEDLTTNIEIGKIYNGIIKKIKDFGIFVECLPNQEGLLHISELPNNYFHKNKIICKVGEKIKVKCLGKDNRGRIDLTII